MILLFYFFFSFFYKRILEKKIIIKKNDQKEKSQNPSFDLITFHLLFYLLGACGPSFLFLLMGPQLAPNKRKVKMEREIKTNFLIHFFFSFGPYFPFEKEKGKGK